MLKLECDRQKPHTLCVIAINLRKRNEDKLSHSQTPLHLAVITHQPHMVSLLVQSGANVNFPDRHGSSSVHLAAQRRDLKCLQALAMATNPLPDFNLRNFDGKYIVSI